MCGLTMSGNLMPNKDPCCSTIVANYKKTKQNK